MTESRPLGRSETWADCAECGDTGLMRDLAPCTTCGRDCACNGPRIEVPCTYCQRGRDREIDAALGEAEGGVFPGADINWGLS